MLIENQIIGLSSHIALQDENMTSQKYKVKVMNLISIRLPESFITLIDEMVLQGRYASRSEAIRLALRDYYREHFASKPEIPMFPVSENLYHNPKIVFDDGD